MSVNTRDVKDLIREDAARSAVTGRAEFLLARIADDEAIAREATDNGVCPSVENEHWSIGDSVECGCCLRVKVGRGTLAVIDDRYAPHVVLHDPARVLAECEAKRRIIVRCSEMQLAQSPMAVHLANATLADLALPYTDHPDFPRC